MYHPNQANTTTFKQPLDVSIVRHGGNGLGGIAVGGNEVAGAGLGGLALEVEGDALLTSLDLLLGVLLHTLDEVLTGARVLNVLDADVDALLHVPVADDLVQEHADGRLGHVVDDAGLAVVDLMGHTILLECLSICLLDGFFCLVSCVVTVCFIPGIGWIWIGLVGV